MTAPQRTVFIRLLAIAGLTLAIASPGFAQASQTNVSNTSPDNDRRQVVPFLDATYVALARATRFDPDLGKSITDATFEADIVPNFVVHQTFFDAIGQLESQRQLQAKSAPGSHASTTFMRAWSIVAVPMVKLRLFFNDPSAPVRTPSYMPKGTGQMFFFDLHDTHSDLIALLGTVGHHSNGQDGCLYAFQHPPDDDPNANCQPTPPLDRTHVEVNRKDGSFSTNYLLFGARYRRIGLELPQTPAALGAARAILEKARAGGNFDEISQAVIALAGAATTVAGKSPVIDKAVQETNDDIRVQDRVRVDEGVMALLDVTDLVVRESRRDATLGVDLELNPGNGSFLGGGGIDPELKSRYGPTRVTFLASIAANWDHVCNRAEAKGFAKYIHHPAMGVPSWAGSIEGQCLFRDTNWGFFARYYAGQDYYNLGFEDDVRRFQFGMTYSQEGFLRFISKAVPEQIKNGNAKARIMAR